MKSTLGQFYTKNYGIIFSGFKLPNVYTFIEPFAGEGDLIEYIKTQTINPKILAYDLEPKKEYITERNTLLSPPNYENKYIVTNPPYLAKNKNKNEINQKIYEKYNESDLYKCFLRSIINSSPIGGLIILPLNFLCSITKKDITLRQDFLSKFYIESVNIFEFSIFSDTSYNVCSIQFKLGKNREIQVKIYNTPTTYKTTLLNLNEENNFTLGGDIYTLKNNKYKVERLLENNTSSYVTNINLCAIDKPHKHSIGLSYDINHYVGKISSRTFATLIITPKINDKTQRRLIEKFNNKLKYWRNKYSSLFLTNYRDNGRKRISFELVYNLVAYFLKEK